MLPNLRFVRQTIGITVSHKIFHRLGAIHRIERVQNQLSVDLHIEEIGVDAAAVISEKMVIRQ